jgi:hypothetical protein
VARTRPIAFHAVRPYLATFVTTPTGGLLQPSCFFDSGAPFCVVTAEIARRMQWSLIPVSSVSPTGQATPFEFHGTPCWLGQADITLYDLAARTRSRCLLVGKFVQRRLPRAEFDRM